MHKRMHLHFEKTINAKSDCSILSLTWMGKVPDEIPEDEGWKLNRTNYYQEGWLATGNVRGIVGVTFTTSHCKKNVDFPPRTNYNLRGHRSEVILVKWNEPYQKLASCDSSGIIFVWIKYEGRWSIELINDRNTPVTNFSWSHDGRMALICYQDGFVLVGSVAGQRYWSSMLNLEATITCGIWTPDDQQVYFGTTSGQIIVMDVHGAMVSQVQLTHDSVGITNMAWSCEKFKMEESDENDPQNGNGERKFVLAVCLQNGIIYLLKTFDDVSPLQINTGLQGPLCMEWSNSREILAIAGIESTSKNSINQNIEYTNILKFYNERGILLYRTKIPYSQAIVSSLTWGHNDKRLFLATGTQIHIAWISRRIATLQLLCRLKIHQFLPDETHVPLLPLPARIRNVIANLFAQTIRCCVPEASNLREFVSKPPSGSVRLHCTMIRHDEDNNLSSGTCYTLYLEYLGGLVPLLKGKRTSKIRPEFVIFDPQIISNCHANSTNSSSSDTKSSSSSSGGTSGGLLISDSSDTEREDGCTSSPRLQRKRKKKRNKTRGNLQNINSSETDNEDLMYVDTLPEHIPLVEVTSNIWGTKFKIHGLEAASTPANLGQVTYKTSLLHLQPRQMTLIVTELRDDFPVLPDPNFNPNLFSEDEDYENSIQTTSSSSPRTSRIPLDNCPPIAPILPNRNNARTKSHQFNSSFLAPENRERTSHLAKAESYEDPDQDLSFCDIIRPQTLTSTNNFNNNVYLNLRPPTAQTSNFVGHQSNTQRHVAAISPLHYESSVPTLQSPKNAVAPSDIIFERPPAGATIISYSKHCEYSGNNVVTVQQLKSTILKNVQIKEIKSIDDESPPPQPPPPPCEPSPSPSSSHQIEMVRSCSVGYLDLVDAQLVHEQMAILKDAATPRRLVLVNKKTKTKRQSRSSHVSTNATKPIRPNLKNCGKSRSLDSSDIFHEKNSNHSNSNGKFDEIIPENSKMEKSININNCSSSNNEEISKNNKKESINSRISHFVSRSPLLRRRKNEKIEKKDEENGKNGQSLHSQALTNLEKLLTKLREDSCGKYSAPSSPRLPRSSPASPAPSKKGKRPQSASPIRRNLLSSPLLGRKNRKNKLQESSDDEIAASGDEKFNGNYRDLETFQKAQLRQKLKRGKIEPNGSSVPFIIPQRREFVMHNKAPMWNENSQVYQLDFGGRVTQESAKNFQIEFRGKQVMQFGRIDGNAYTLDFQYPFSALQAFSVALANVTQRLK